MPRRAANRQENSNPAARLLRSDSGSTSAGDFAHYAIRRESVKAAVCKKPCRCSSCRHTDIRRWWRRRISAATAKPSRRHRSRPGQTRASAVIEWLHPTLRRMLFRTTMLPRNALQSMKGLPIGERCSHFQQRDLALPAHHHVDKWLVERLSGKKTRMPATKMTGTSDTESLTACRYLASPREIIGPVSTEIPRQSAPCTSRSTRDSYSRAQSQRRHDDFKSRSRSGAARSRQSGALSGAPSYGGIKQR